MQTGRKNESCCSDREKERERARAREKEREREEREAARERQRQTEREKRERKAGPQVAKVKPGVEPRHLKSSGNPLIAPDSQEWKASEHLKRYTGRNMQTHTMLRHKLVHCDSKMSPGPCFRGLVVPCQA